jgi:hypothetical protein
MSSQCSRRSRANGWCRAPLVAELGMQRLDLQRAFHSLQLLGDARRSASAKSSNGRPAPEVGVIGAPDRLYQ